MADRHARAAAIADRIQAELQRLGRWATAPIDPGRLVDMGAFGRNTLAAEEWIQFVLVPRIRELAAKHDAFPATSETATWATREFDGDPDAGPLVELLRELDALIEAGDGGEPPRPDELNAAVARGDRDEVARLLARGAQVNARGPHGVTALHVAAAGGHAALPKLLANPLEVDVATILRGDGDLRAIAELLLDHGADKDVQGDAGLTPLMVASYFGRAEVADVLCLRGADAHLRDSWGRTAERLVVFQTVARAIALCRTVPAIASAYLVQVHAPVTHQYTTPALGLELSGQLPPDAFATWPPDQPIVVFGVGGEDAVSRLVRLTPPIYPHLARSALGLASAIAAGVSGTVRELPSAEDRSPAYTVVLPDGRMPVLVREFGHSFGISAAGRSWHPSPGKPDTAEIRQVVAATLKWSAEPESAVTIAELASDLAATLTAALGTHWTVSIPGTPVPSEMWLRGGDASVGVFAGRIVLDDEHLEIRTRDELVHARPRVVAKVREMLEQHGRMVRLSERMHAIARELAERLAARLGGSCTVKSHGQASLTPIIHWASDGSERDIVELRGAVGLRGKPDTIHAHAGVVGRDGWDGEADQVDDEKLAAIVVAIEFADRTLTIYKLVVGQRYRVRETIDELVKGAIVEFAGFNDIDNHHGLYEFLDSSGKRVAVGGDFSTPHHSRLGETHRYLEPVPD